MNQIVKVVKMIKNNSFVIINKLLKKCYLVG